MWIYVGILAALIVLELVEGNIRGSFWRVWLTREKNPMAYWAIIGVEAATIILILFLRYE